jgi:hypothetical protein
LLCDSAVDVVSSLLLVSAILMAVREQPFHLSRCPNFRNRLNLPKPLNNSQLGVRLKIGGHLELRDTLRVKRGDSHAYLDSESIARARLRQEQRANCKG